MSSGTQTNDGAPAGQPEALNAADSAGWRMLEPHEVVREGDEWCVAGKTWVRARRATGETVASARGDLTFEMRRRIRIQNDGWRWLDEGETIREGDEWVDSSGPRAVTRFIGREMVNTTIRVRRRIDAQRAIDPPVLGQPNTSTLENYAECLPAIDSSRTLGIPPKQTDAQEDDGTWECPKCHRDNDAEECEFYCEYCEEPNPSNPPEQTDEEWLEAPLTPEEERAFEEGTKGPSFCLVCDGEIAEGEKHACPGEMCGCGKHAIDPSGDTYAQHRAWLTTIVSNRDRPLIVEHPYSIHDVYGLRCIGVSRPEVEVLVQIDLEDYA